MLVIARLGGSSWSRLGGGLSMLSFIAPPGRLEHLEVDHLVSGF